MFSIKESLGVGWRKFMERPWYLFGIALAVSGLFLAVSSESAMFTALAYVLYAGYLAFLFKHFNTGGVSFDELFDADKRWIYFAFLAVIKGFLLLLGFLLLIVPGIYLAVRWMFAEFYVVEKGMRPLEALRASSELTKGHRWKLFWFSLIATVLLILSLLLLVVGILPASLVLTFAMMHIYYALQKTPEAAPQGEAGSDL